MRDFGGGGRGGEGVTYHGRKEICPWHHRTPCSAPSPETVGPLQHSPAHGGSEENAHM